MSKDKNKLALNSALAVMFAATAFSVPLAALADEAPPESAQMRKAESLYGRGKVKEAIAEFREAIRLEPNNAKAHQRLGAALAANEDYETAILEEQQAIKLDPKYFLPHVVLGQIYANQSKIDLALKEFREGYHHTETN
ncbi:MAG: tetratricopeptide repeat protein [Candidatus Obscuribacterales bacterium]